MKIVKVNVSFENGALDIRKEMVTMSGPQVMNLYPVFGKAMLPIEQLKLNPYLMKRELYFFESVLTLSIDDYLKECYLLFLEKSLFEAQGVLYFSQSPQDSTLKDLLFRCRHTAGIENAYENGAVLSVTSDGVRFDPLYDDRFIKSGQDSEVESFLSGSGYATRVLVSEISLEKLLMAYHLVKEDAKLAIKTLANQHEQLNKGETHGSEQLSLELIS